MNVKVKGHMTQNEEKNQGGERSLEMEMAGLSGRLQNPEFSSKKLTAFCVNSAL